MIEMDMFLSAEIIYTLYIQITHICCAIKNNFTDKLILALIESLKASDKASLKINRTLQ